MIEASTVLSSVVYLGDCLKFTMFSTIPDISVVSASLSVNKCIPYFRTIILGIEINRDIQIRNTFFTIFRTILLLDFII